MNKAVKLDTVQLVTVPKFAEDTGFLTVYDEKGAVPFDIARVFVVGADGGQQRGRHAHRACAQLIVCLHGACNLVCEDGRERSTVRLDTPEQGLLIPPGIWAEQDYLADDTLLMVLCDRSYDEADYVRDYDEFLKWKNET